jgi:hypothetical protein
MSRSKTPYASNVVGKRYYTLVPYNREECLSLKEAAAAAGKCDRTVRTWCEVYGIGRRVGGGTWVVSKVALKMLLEGDIDALLSYRDHGVRGSYEPVAKYYHQLDLGELLSLREFAV